MAWHPTDPKLIIGGDDDGSLRGFTNAGDALKLNQALPGRIVGLAFTPDGSRVGAASADGSVLIFDHKWVGRVLALRSDGETPQSLHFDPTGHRLAAVHRDGRIRLWETGRATNDQRVDTWRWKETTLLGPESSRQLDLRPQSAGIDREGRLCLLYSREVHPRRSANNRRVVLGRDVGDTWNEITLLDDLPLNATWRIIALSVDEGGLTAAVRRPEGQRGGGLSLFRLENAAGSHQPPANPRPTIVEEHPRPAIDGFDLHLLPSGGEWPGLLHFTHEGHFLQLTRRAAGEWTTRVIGTRGDGIFNQSVIVGPRLHSVFHPLRLGSDPSPLTYLTSPVDSGDSSREILDPSTPRFSGSIGSEPRIIASPRGEPAVVYARQGAHGRIETVFAIRSSGEWTKNVIIKDAIGARSNLTCDDSGVFRFAFSDRDGRRILLATGVRPTWRLEKIWEGIDDEYRIGEATSSFPHHAPRPSKRTGRRRVASPQRAWLATRIPADRGRWRPAFPVK